MSFLVVFSSLRVSSLGSSSIFGSFAHAGGFAVSLLLPSGCLCCLVTGFAFLKIFFPGLGSVFSRSSCSWRCLSFYAILSCCVLDLCFLFRLSTPSVSGCRSFVFWTPLPACCCCSSSIFFSSASASYSPFYFLLSPCGMLAPPAFLGFLGFASFLGLLPAVPAGAPFLCPLFCTFPPAVFQPAPCSYYQRLTVFCVSTCSLWSSFQFSASSGSSLLHSCSLPSCGFSWAFPWWFGCCFRAFLLVFFRCHHSLLRVLLVPRAAFSLPSWLFLFVLVVVFFAPASVLGSSLLCCRGFWLFLF